MANVDTRQVNRESLFLLAQVRVVGQDSAVRVRVRNLSPRGMMAEGDAKVARGSLVSIELRNIGWIEGSVAWKQDNRFGIAFLAEIDPAVVREPADDSAPAYEIPKHTLAKVLPAGRPRLRKL
ncbi:MAG: PilZ domain-containing protein [Croceibacterium sp.]